MTVTQAALLVAVGAPWLAAILIFTLGEARQQARTLVGLTAAGVATGASVLVGAHVAGGGEAATVGIPLLGAKFALAADRLGALFAVIAAGLWLVTTVYATGYMAHGKDRARFFGFFAICVGSAVGIALSANLLTLFIFYEALTLATYPLVVHTGTAAAARGGRTYLYYALTGGAVLAVGVVWLYTLAGATDFSFGGSLPTALMQTQRSELMIIFALLVAGFGVKAALFPAHGWLPAAMVAPAPVSALLHAVAVVKAGVFGIARVVLDLFGPNTAASLGVLGPLALIAAFTIVFASIRALAHDDIKKRLAYSTIGQLSYIVLGLAIGTPVAIAAALAHLAHHALLKITMFFTAGALAEELKIYRVSDMDGVGKRMPITMVAFTIAALGIIGVPPIAGFVSKWGLGLGGLEGGVVWPLGVLAISSVLNATYFMPMIGRAWFGTPRTEWLVDKVAKGSGIARPEGDRRLVWPLALTAVLGLALGPLAAAPWAPTKWAAAIAGARAELSVPWRIDLVALDAQGALFLVLAVVVWLAAGIASWKASGHDVVRYRVFVLLAAVGSFGLAFAGDAAMFYACFSIMALAAYGLITHDGSKAARQAGRTYIAFTLIAEVLLLAGLMIGSFGSGPSAIVLAGSRWVDLGTGMLLLAFGIKIGTIGLHGWMPSAYQAAPAGAGAALAGVASSAGVLGMIRFLPGGVSDLTGWGNLLMGAGLVAAFFGALVGCMQREPRHVLAYSSMSQFGLMTIGIGAGLSSSSIWPVAASAVGVYLVHHGLAKAALFISHDLSKASGSRRWIMAASGVCGLALAGFPLTSGAIAKVAMKKVVAETSAPWASVLDVLLPIAAVGTTLLMARFIVLAFTVRRKDNQSQCEGRAYTLSLALILVFVVGLLWLVGYKPVSYAAAASLNPHYLLALTWPVIVGVTIALAAWSLRTTIASRFLGAVPPGDLWAPLVRRLDQAWVAYQERLAMPRDEIPEKPAVLDRLACICAVEARMLTWPVASAAMVVLALLALTLAF